MKDQNLEIDLKELLKWKPAIDSMNGYEWLNQIQMQVFNDAYNSEKSTLICSATGSGKTLCAELAVLNFFRHLAAQSEASNEKAVYISPQ